MTLGNVVSFVQKYPHYHIGEMRNLGGIPSRATVAPELKIMETTKSRRLLLLSISFDCLKFGRAYHTPFSIEKKNLPKPSKRA